MKKDKVQDFYFHKAKREKFSARSVYKLQDIQEKYQLMQPGNRILDLGAAPGSWCEYVSALLGPKGYLAALDLKPLSAPAQEKIKKSGVSFEFMERSVFDPLPENLPTFDLIISDMAPSTQGNRMVDTQNSLELIIRAFEIAKQHLKRDGHFIIKLFQSNDTVQTTKTWGKYFEVSKLYRPPAVQKDSKEVYFIGRQFKVASENP